MATSTVENYIKTVYTLQFEQGEGGKVGMGDLATALRITPGTATTMVKSLAKTGLLRYFPRIGVQLTDQGEELALLVLRRHRLVELFLVKVLGMDWHEIHEEAEALEHVISDRVLERIDALLGRPELDPHGDPIPSATGAIAQRDLQPLADCQPGQSVRIGRIENQEEAFLQYLETNALTPGRLLTVRGLDPQAGLMAVSLEDGATCQLGFEAARKIHVELGEQAS